MSERDRVADRLAALLERGVRDRDWPGELALLPADECQEIEPMLRALATLVATPRPALSPPGRARAWRRLLAGAGELRRERAGQRRGGWLGGLTPRLQPAFLALLLLLGSFGTAAASQLALPGDRLYPLKRLTEEMGIALAEQVGRGQALGHLIAQRRVGEAEDLAAEGRTGTLTLDAAVQEAGPGRIMVAGRALPAAEHVRVPAPGRARVRIDVSPAGPAVVEVELLDPPGPAGERPGGRPFWLPRIRVPGLPFVSSGDDGQGERNP